LKLIDFGSACTYTRGTQVTDKAGTLHFAAPEVFTGSYCEKCDIWSIGVVIFMLSVGYLPLRGKTDHDTLKLVKAGTIQFKANDWKHVQGNLQDLVADMLTKEAGARPSAKQIAVSNDWLLQPQKECCLVL